MTKQISVAAATRKAWPRMRVEKQYDTAAWQTAGLTFWFDPDNVVAPATGVFEVLDSRAASTDRMVQPTGHTAMTQDTKDGYLGGGKTIRADLLEGAGASDGSQSASYQWLESGTGKTPTGVGANFGLWFTVHPFSATVDVGGSPIDGSNGLALRLVNGVVQARFNFTNVTLDPGLGTSGLVNKGLIVGVTRVSNIPTIHLLIEGEDTWRTSVGASQTAVLSGKFSIGKALPGYAVSSYNAYARFGTCLAFNADIGSTMLEEVRDYLAVRAGFI